MVSMTLSRSTKDISQVDLGELGLAVGAGVLVAEAAADLHVAVAAGDHQDLLEELGALREGVPLPGCRRLGTRKSRAPSGVLLQRMGVSISRKPFSSK
jgi:hypothetical protein